MEQGNIATPDELQQAINSITNGGATPVSGAVDVAAPAGSAAATATPAAPAPEQAEPAASAPNVPVKAQYGDPDLDKVKSMALSDLRPILEKVDIAPDKKFMIYREIIELTEDKACIEPAYNAARLIEDDKVKGEALVFIVECIDKLGIQVAIETEEK